jgi:drug/metabolite transporter (DMT)-like permease
MTRHSDYALLGLLALLWGSSYLFIKVAVAEIPPLTLIALRVSGASAFMLAVLYLKRQSLPRARSTWARMFVQ